MLFNTVNNYCPPGLSLKEHYLNPENRKNASDKLKIYYKTHEHHRIGSRLTQEHKDIISKLNTGRIYTDERNKKISVSLRVFHKQRTHERRSKSHKEYYKTHEVWNKGLKHSQATKEHMSKGMIEYWKQRKQLERKQVVEWWERDNG